MENIKPPEWDEFNDPEIVDWKRVRSAIEHENMLLNHRFTWLLTSQGFLASGFYFVWQASNNPALSPDGKLLLQLILFTVVFVGLFTAVHLTLGLRAAHIQHDALRDWWKKRPKTSGRHPEICGSDPLLPYFYFALVFAFAWIVLGVIGLFDFIKPYKDTITIVISALAILGVGFISGQIFRKRS